MDRPGLPALPWPLLHVAVMTYSQRNLPEASSVADMLLDKLSPLHEGVSFTSPGFRVRWAKRGGGGRARVLLTGRVCVRPWGS